MHIDGQIILMWNTKNVYLQLHKLLKQPHQLIVYWENILHQALLQKHAAKVEYQGSSNTKILWPCQ